MIAIVKDEEIQRIGYYAVIPATVLFNERLKPNEKLLYALITALSNKEGYCYASNKYLGEKLGVDPVTVSRWITDLRRNNYVFVDIMRNEKKEIICRRIFPNDVPYRLNNQYPYILKNQEGIDEKVKDNNIIDNNINNKIDRLFNYIIDKENEIPNEFIDVEYDEIITALKRYDMYYTKESIEYMSKENLNKIKEITYTIALIVKNKLFYLTKKVSRDKLIQVYNDCKNRQASYKDTDNQIENFANYYYKSIENELTKDLSPSFFMPNNSEIEVEM